MHAYVVEYIVDGGNERRFPRAMESKTYNRYSQAIPIARQSAAEL